MSLLPKRVLGRTGRELSVVGFGGIIVTDETAADSRRYVESAIARGVNYFDVSPNYGNAQEMLGPALRGYRDGVFLACKTERRDGKSAERELAGSLKALETDHFDLYQFHTVRGLGEVDQIFSKGGAMEVFVKAREKGLIKHIGFSAHTEAAGLAMLERFDFDSVMFPVNWVSWLHGGFGAKLMSAAVAKGVGIIGLKSLGLRALKGGESSSNPKCWYEPVGDYETAEMALRFTLSEPVTAAISPGDFKLFGWACDAAERFEPLSESEMAVLAERSKDYEPIFPKHYTEFE